MGKYKPYKNIDKTIKRIANLSIQRSAEHRENVKRAVKEAMTMNPGLSAKQLTRETGYAYCIVCSAYYQFKRGEL